MDRATNISGSPLAERLQNSLLAAGQAIRHRDIPWPPFRPLALCRAALDLAIAVYAVGLLTIVIAGGASLVFLSFHRAEKPVIALLLLVPLRVAIGGRSWLPAAVGSITREAADVWARLRARVAPGIIDSLLVAITVWPISWAAAFLAHLMFPNARPSGFSLPFANAGFVEIFTAWDSGWYWDIAARGYYFTPDGQSSIAFFPLYPMLMRLAAAPFGGGAGATWIAGIGVALAAELAALVALHSLTQRMFGSREIARRTILYLSVFPWSLFHTRVYAESVFLLASTMAVSGAYDGRWWKAGTWGALATLARPNGILIAIPLALMALAGKPDLRRLGGRAAALALIPLALAGFCWYAFALTGDALAWMSAQSQWGYSLGHAPWQQLQRVVGSFFQHGPYGYFLTSPGAPIELLHTAIALLILGLTPIIFRRLGAALGTYVLISILVPLSSNALEGLGRYASVLFPVFMLLGSMTRARGHEALVMVSLVFQTLLTGLFVNWYQVY